VQQAPKTLGQVGLETIEKDGYLVVQGNTYGKTEILKSLGFEFRDNEWKKELPVGEEIIDIEIASSEPVNNQTSPKSISPAHELMRYLIEKGIEKARVGEFVKDVLGTSSSDIEGIKAALADKNALDQKIINFLSEPSAHEVEIEEVF